MSPGKKDGGAAHQLVSSTDEVAYGVTQWHFFKCGGAPESFGDGDGPYSTGVSREVREAD
jgi:hypothetical protein